MKSFKFFLSEGRKNAKLKVQQRLNTLQTLEKWSSSPDIHISYTAMRKIGVNPKSKFMDTPLAVYAYPLKEIWADIQNEGVRNVKFAANTSKFIYVLKERGQKLKDVSDYTKSNLTSDLAKIRGLVSDEVYSKALEDFQKTVGSENFPPYRHLQYFIYRIASASNKRSIAGIAATMSSILSQLGYSGFSDRKGTGQIHPAEEIQTYFLSPKAYEVVDVIEIKDIDTKDVEIRDMSDYLKKNASKLSNDDIIKIVWKDFSLARYMGTPRTEVLKVFMDKNQAERWKSKQSRSDDPDYDGKDYIAAENPMQGTEMLFYYDKLPEDLLSWGVSHPNTMVSNSFIHWMKVKKYKPSDSFVAANIKHNAGLIKLLPTVSKAVAKAVIKHHGYQYTISDLSAKMSEKDIIDILGGIQNFDVSSIFNYHEPVAKFLYNQLMKNKNPSDNDIDIVASYIQKSGRNPQMDLINGLKTKFPNYDFTQIGGWAFWKR
jgi:hypothetical protein